MPSLWITSNDTHAKLQSERVIITPTTDDSDLETTRSIPLIDVDLLVASHRVTLSTPLIHKLLEKNIPIFFLNAIGQIRGQFLPPQPSHGNTRLLQYQASLNKNNNTHIAADLIAAKIYNQRRCIQRLSLNRKETPLPSGIFRRFSSAIHRLKKHSPPPQQILGIEGAASADFFTAWAAFLPAEFPFHRRTRRPPLNPVNACLSFASTLIYQEMIAACFAAGLDPAIGTLHTTDNKRWALPLDLIEPLRPVIAEALTLDLFSRHILNATHFEPHADGIYLNTEGRKKLTLQYEKRLERHFHSEHLDHRTSLRQILRNLPLQYKKHLTDHTPFTPFKMN